MKFEDKVIKSMRIKDPSDLAKLIIEYLCGEEYYNYKRRMDYGKELFSETFGNIKNKSLTYKQFNELLLLLGQQQVSKGFFRFFFGNEKVSFEKLKKGIISFRGYSMLYFGNFRFAYKQLSQKNEEELKKIIFPRDASSRQNKKHSSKILKIEEIKGDKTWYIGYISKQKFGREAKYAQRLVESETNAKVKEKLLGELKNTYDNKYEKIYNKHFKIAKKYASRFEKIDNEIRESERKALKNTNVYLNQAEIDIYVATSMRQKREFEETFNFIHEVFPPPKNRKLQSEPNANENPLKKLELSYFDPTQSLCSNRIDKALTEGLMLKRALCTIYMAQQNDTMGKDSELASTLAQGKPVIAYVPQKTEEEAYAKEIKEYSLDFLKKRLLILQAEGVLEKENFEKALKAQGYSVEKAEYITNRFISKLKKHHRYHPFSLIDEEETKFKEGFPEFDDLCKILAVIELHNFEARARTLKEVHPLSIQVNLQSGIANGVLVVRNSKDCARLIYRILTNNTEFEIRHIKIFSLSQRDYNDLCSLLGKKLCKKFIYDSSQKTLCQVKILSNTEVDKIEEELSNNEKCPKGLKKTLKDFSFEGVTILEEKISQSPYRVITNNANLVNSFWNFYLHSNIQST